MKFEYMDTVQIFIPTFNRRHSLEMAVASALNQTYPSIEVVVLDNASVDETRSFMLKMTRSNSRVKYHRNPENIGMVGNFNRIRELVTQPFFCVLTDDDVYEPHFVATAMKLFQDYPSIALAATNAPVRKGGVITNEMIKDWAEGFHSKGTQVQACSRSKHPLFTHCIFRQQIAREFIFHEAIWSVSDGFLLTSLATKYDMAVSKTITGYWNIHGENSTEQQKWDPMTYITALAAIKKLYEDFCNINALPNVLAAFHKQRLLIGLLQVGHDPAVLDQIVHKSNLVENFPPWQLQVIRMLCKIHFLEAALWVKGTLRNMGVIH